MQSDQLNLRLERLTDALIDRVIEADVYHSRKEAFFVEQVALREKIKNDTATTATPAHIQKFFELIQNLYLVDREQLSFPVRIVFVRAKTAIQ